MKRKLALVIAIVFIWGVMAPMVAEGGIAFENGTTGKRVGINPKTAYRTSESTKLSIASTFENRRLKEMTYKKGQVIVKVKNVAILKKDIVEKWNMKIEKQFTEDLFLISFDESKRTMSQTLKSLNGNKEVYFAEPNYIRKISSFAKEIRKVDYSSWWYRKANVENAWSITKGSPDVIVGIMDTGVDYRHEDLSDNIYVNKGEIPGDSIDNDNNGYVDDVYGYDFGDGDSDPMDTSEHGTHVAGIIAAEENDKGITGIAPKVRLLPLKLSNEKDGTMLVSAEVEAIQYARKIGVEIFNCSFGSFETDPAEYEIIKSNPDAIFVCASGNGDEETHVAVNTDATPHYPSDYELPNIISVAAIGENGLLTAFSDYGQNTVDLGAPGDDIYSTVENNRYEYLSGTSMATPFVTGALALMRSVDPYVSVVKLRTNILTTVDVVDSLKTKLTTGGSLNVNAAVLKTKTGLIPVSGMEISQNKLNLYSGTEGKLEALLLPLRIQSRSIIWTSENPAIATVDEYGNVKAISKGSTEIKASEKTTGIYKSCVVKVIEFVPPVLKVGKTVNLTFKTPVFIEGKARLWLIRPDGTEDSFEMKLDRDTQKYTVSIQSDKDGSLTPSELDPFKYYGTWEVEMIEVVDNNDNSYNFYNKRYFGGDDERHIPMNFEGYKFIVGDNYHQPTDTSLGVTETSMDKKLGKDIVYSGSEKSTDEVGIGNKLLIKIFAKAKTGIYTAYVTYVKPNGEEVEENFGINLKGSYYYMNMYVTEKTGQDDSDIHGILDQGSWKTKEIRMIDMARNNVYLKDSRYSQSPEAVDLSGLDFSVKSEKVSVSGMRYREPLLKLALGKVYRPEILVNPENVSQPDFVYKSSNPKVATVNICGVITPQKSGTAVITASLRGNGSISAFTKVMVK